MRLLQEEAQFDAAHYVADLQDTQDRLTGGGVGGICSDIFLRGLVLFKEGERRLYVSWQEETLCGWMGGAGQITV